MDPLGDKDFDSLADKRSFLLLMKEVNFYPFRSSGFLCILFQKKALIGLSNF